MENWSDDYSNLPWLVGDDLNEIFYNSEKKGGPPKSLLELDDFRNAFIHNGICDLGFSGYEFTWCNYRGDNVIVEEQLDRFCTDKECSLIFSDAQVSHVDFDCFG